MPKEFRAAVTLMGLLLQAGAAHAADAKICDAYVKEATAKAQGIRQFNCGFDVNDPRWSSDRSGHAAWCKSADKETVERESARRRGEIKLCQTCRAYAGLAVSAAADNAKLKCGFEGPRWGGKAEDHFGWCMARYERAAADGADVAAASRTALEKMQRPINLETTVRILQVTDCKSRQSNARKASRKP